MVFYWDCRILEDISKSSVYRNISWNGKFGYVELMNILVSYHQPVKVAGFGYSLTLFCSCRDQRLFLSGLGRKD